ncbi:MAG: hypothetical protein ABIJ57_00465, partial [Pseudomonadota bacterium]
MPEGDQVTPQGDQGNQDVVNQSLGWRSALPDDQKEHEFVKTFTKPGDFVKSALEIKADRDALKGKLDSAIFKPDDKATPEQREAYLRTLGKPEKATEYVFPKTEGIERDPKFVEWAQNTFHKIGLPKEMGEQVAAQFDAFTLEMVKANQEAVTKAKTEAETALKAELKDGYPAAIELTKRFLTKYAKPEDMAFLDESGMGNHPALIRMIVDFAKKTG